MRRRIALYVSVLLTVAAHAQTPDQPMTHAQAMKELEELESVGYYPTRASSLRFPYDIEDAQARLAAKHREQSQIQISRAPDSR